MGPVGRAGPQVRRGPGVTVVGVIAHQKKSLGGGLVELRRLLADRGFTEPIWYEVPKSRKAPRMARQAVDEGADLLLLWGGDGTVQRCTNALRGSDVTVAVIPAGTANLLANNLGIPTDLPAALDIALHGARRRLDVGVLNGERFAVMAGAGADAIIMRDADGGKDHFGRLAYVWAGAGRPGHRPSGCPSKSTAPPGSRALPVVCCWAIWGPFSAGSPPFREPGPTTGSSR